MATVMDRTAPGVGRRMVLVGAAGVLLGGIAGGVIGGALDSSVQRGATLRPAPVVLEAAPATDIDRVRAAHNYAFHAPARAASIDLVRTRYYAFRAPMPAAAANIDHVRTDNYVFQAPTPANDIDRARALNYATGKQSG
jgi:hypothetical protein